MLISAVTRRSIPARLGAFIATGVVLVFATRASAQSVCSSAPLAVQVLGSGGPSAGGTRASTGYLVWRDGRAVVMVDAGGGTFLRFGEAGARLQDLSLLAISHLHPDHVSDLPALLWLSELARQQPLKIAGPTGAGAFPSFDAFIRRLFDTSSGAFPILGGTLGQPGQGVRLDVVTVDATVGTASTVWSDDDLEVSAIGVPHGNAPSIAYRIRVGDRSIVFGSDALRPLGTSPRAPRADTCEAGCRRPDRTEGQSQASGVEPLHASAFDGQNSRVVQSVRSRRSNRRGSEALLGADRRGR